METKSTRIEITQEDLLVKTQRQEACFSSDSEAMADRDRHSLVQESRGSGRRVCGQYRALPRFRGLSIQLNPQERLDRVPGPPPEMVHLSPFSQI